jgi:hypothetical protein
MNPNMSYAEPKFRIEETEIAERRVFGDGDSQVGFLSVGGDRGRRRHPG